MGVKADPEAREAARAKTKALGKERNADIHPSPDYVGRRPDFAKLISNEPVAAQFDRYERIAVTSKRWYSALGVLSLTAAFITFAMLIYNVTIDRLPWPNLHLHDNPWVRLALAVVGALGLAMQIIILASPLKKKWLGARFIAERLRCLKFEAFQQAAAVGANHEEAVAAFTEDSLERLLAFPFTRPTAFIRNFKPEKALNKPPIVSGGLASDQLNRLKEIYVTMRLDYQLGFASGEVMDLREKQRLPAAASEIAFWGGLAAGYIDAIASIAGAGENLMTSLHFLTLILFTVSALLFVRERGSGFSAAIERYEEYERALDSAVAMVNEAETPEAFIAAVRDGETACLRELKTFCKETERSTYLF